MRSAAARRHVERQPAVQACPEHQTAQTQSRRPRLRRPSDSICRPLRMVSLPYVLVHAVGGSSARSRRGGRTPTRSFSGSALMSRESVRRSIVSRPRRCVGLKSVPDRLPEQQQPRRDRLVQLPMSWPTLRPGATDAGSRPISARCSRLLRQLDDGRPGDRRVRSVAGRPLRSLWGRAAPGVAPPLPQRARPSAAAL